MHIKLKNFIHPMCEYCDIEFDRRIEWDKHKLTAKHLLEVEKAGQTQPEPEYYSPLDFTSLLNLKDKKGEKNEDEASQGPKDQKDSYDIERRQETAQLGMDKIGQFEVPGFDESKMIGESYLSLLNLALLTADILRTLCHC